MFQSNISKKKTLRAGLAAFACICVMFAQSASAHPLTVWPSSGDKPIMRAEQGAGLDVWLTVPAPIFTPANSLLGTVNVETGDLAAAIFWPDGTSADIEMLGFYSHRSPDLGLMQREDANVT